MRIIQQCHHAAGNIRSTQRFGAAGDYGGTNGDATKQDHGQLGYMD